MIGGTTIIALTVGTLLAATVGAFAHIVGYDRDRSFYAVVLTVVGSLYVLFTLTGAGGDGLVPEIGFFAVFAALAAVGFRTSPWIIAFGLALHGVFDLIRATLLPAPGAPGWWPAFCGSYDIVAAFGLAALLILQGRKRRDPAGR